MAQVKRALDFTSTRLRERTADWGLEIWESMLVAEIEDGIRLVAGAESWAHLGSIHEVV